MAFSERRPQMLLRHVDGTENAEGRVLGDQTLRVWILHNDRIEIRFDLPFPQLGKGVVAKHPITGSRMHGPTNKSLICVSTQVSLPVNSKRNFPLAHVLWHELEHIDLNIHFLVRSIALHGCCNHTETQMQEHLVERALGF